MTLTMTMAQINTTVGDFAGNLAQVMAALDQAPEADLVVFPELALTGYPAKDRLFEPAFLAGQERALAALRAYSCQRSNQYIALGVITPNPGPGRPLFNSLSIVCGGQERARYHKQLLPDYDVFEEHRYFAAGPATPCVLNIAGCNIGFLICEDSWNGAGTGYDRDPVRLLVDAGAQMLVSVNASPGTLGKQPMREAALRRSRLPFIYVNQVGGNDDLVFDGASFAGDASGVHMRMAYCAPAVQTLRFDRGRGAWDVPEAMNTSELLCEEAQCFQLLSLGLRDYLHKSGIQRVVVGSSGGIDSAVVIALAALALGPGQVEAVTMPSRWSSTGSVADSALLCQALGVRLYEHPIAALVEQFTADYATAFAHRLTGLAAENLQARIRGVILMAYANQQGALLVTTGNKSEMSVGYCTLYGDTNGGLGIIGDLYKTDVYRLARWINQHYGAPIPQAVLDKAPSAELAPGQKDQDSLPPYDTLDALLMEYLEDGPRVVEDAALRQRVQTLLDRAEFKRKQAPPILKVRTRSFGSGRRMPIVQRRQESSD